jgi:hypothetical protein
MVPDGGLPAGTGLRWRGSLRDRVHHSVFVGAAAMCRQHGLPGVPAIGILLGMGGDHQLPVGANVLGPGSLHCVPKRMHAGAADMLRHHRLPGVPAIGILLDVGTVAGLSDRTGVLRGAMQLQQPVLLWAAAMLWRYGLSGVPTIGLLLGMGVDHQLPFGANVLGTRNLLRMHPPVFAGAAAMLWRYGLPGVPAIGSLLGVGVYQLLCLGDDVLGCGAMCLQQSVLFRANTMLRLVLSIMCAVRVLLGLGRDDPLSLRTDVRGQPVRLQQPVFLRTEAVL